MSKTPKNEIQSITQCFKWLYTIIFYTGILSFRLNNGSIKKPTVLGVLYVYAVRTSLLLGLYGGYVLKLSNKENYQVMFGTMSPLVKFILVFECLNSTFGYLLVAVLMDLRKYSYIRFANRFDQLDEGLKSEFPGIDWNYHKSERKYTPMTLFIAIFYLVMAQIFFFSLAKNSSDVLTTLFMATAYAMMTGSTGCMCFLHIAAMDILRLRYRLLQKLAAYYTANHEKYKDRQLLYARIASLIKYCRDYTELILDINDVFANVAGVGIFCDFGILTTLTYLICQKALEGDAAAREYVLILLLMIPRMYKVLMTACYGRTVNSERKSCVHAMTGFGIDFHDSTSLRQTLKSFLHWKMQQNYELTVGKIMSCNLNIAFMVLNGISNYVLVLIQLQFQQNSIQRVNRVNNHDLSQVVETFTI